MTDEYALETLHLLQ